MNILKKISGLPLFVIFLTLYSILSFLSTNLSQVNLAAANRLLLAFGIGTVHLLLLVWRLTRNLNRVGVIVFIFLIIFYAYGHIKAFLRVNAHALSRNIILFPISLTLFFGGLFLVSKLSQDKLNRTTRYVNLACLILLFFPIGSLIVQEVRIAFYLRVYRARVETNSIHPVAVDGALPDVYFIILDGYARSDVLQQDLGFNNLNFLVGLRQDGFYVADCSMSNYAQTEQSMASTLNMDYLDELLSQVPAAAWNDGYFAPWIQHSLVRRFFDSLGYKTVSFYTGYYWAQWEDATYYFNDSSLNNSDPGSSSPNSGYILTSFEKTYLETTMVRGIFEIYQELGLGTESSFLPPIADSRAVVLFPLDNLPEIATLDGPKFTFLHLLLPHPPYVFGPNGEVREIVTDDFQTRLNAYVDQVRYANSRILPLVDELITQNNGNVVIILEGDHGLLDYQEPWTRMANLSAYYFPDQDYSKLYPNITPVNSFRVLLSQYFGQEYPLLPDNSYFSLTSVDKTMELIPNTCVGK